MASAKGRSAGYVSALAGMVLSLNVAAPVQAAAIATYMPIGGFGNDMGFFADDDGAVFTPVHSGEPTGSRIILFSYVDSSLRAGVNNVMASIQFSASTQNNPALAGNFLVESGVSGSFAIISQQLITLDGITYAPGLNLLSGTFTNAALGGLKGGTSASLGASTGGGSTVTYTSSLLSFGASTTRDFAFSFSNLSAAFDSTGTGSERRLNDFTAASSGIFSADVVVTAVPEPGEWAMLVAGLAVVGAAARRRSA